MVIGTRRKLNPSGSSAGTGAGVESSKDTRFGGSSSSINDIFVFEFDSEMCASNL